ncbi:MAG: hypothetical protein HEP71_29380 [Roseivirga sp.]|nr:hypothetical protein [Roseivirga sp.]
MSNPTNWAKLCRYTAILNIGAVMAFAAALLRFLLKSVESQGDISPSVVSYGGVYHLPFLFVAILTLLLSKRMTLGLQKGLVGLNTLMAIFTLFQVVNLLGE